MLVSSLWPPVSSIVANHGRDSISPYSRSVCSSSEWFTFLTLYVFFLWLAHLTHTLCVFPLHGLPCSHLCVTIYVIYTCMHFTIFVTVDCEHEPTFVFTPVLSLLLVVSILVQFYLHLCDFIPAQRDLPSLDCVSHYQQRDYVCNCADNLIEELSSVYFYQNSLSRYTICLPRLNCPFGDKIKLKSIRV